MYILDFCMKYLNRVFHETNNQECTQVLMYFFKFQFFHPLVFYRTETMTIENVRNCTSIKCTYLIFAWIQYLNILFLQTNNEECTLDLMYFPKFQFLHALQLHTATMTIENVCNSTFRKCTYLIFAWIQYFNIFFFKTNNQECTLVLMYFSKFQFFMHYSSIKEHTGTMTMKMYVTLLLCRVHIWFCNKLNISIYFLIEQTTKNVH